MSHNDCFLGSEAVDAVADYIGNEKAFEGETADQLRCVRLTVL